MHRRAKLPARGSIPFTSDDLHGNCVDTAAIVIPGPFSERGQGLRSGFKGLCFNYRIDVQEAINESHDEKTALFHVIFHDYYTEEEAIGTTDMLANSEISCNTCKNKIRF